MKLKLFSTWIINEVTCGCCCRRSISNERYVQLWTLLSAPVLSSRAVLALVSSGLWLLLRGTCEAASPLPKLETLAFLCSAAIRFGFCVFG